MVEVINVGVKKDPCPDCDLRFHKKKQCLNISIKVTMTAMEKIMPTEKTHFITFVHILECDGHSCEMRGWEYFLLHSM